MQGEPELRTSFHYDHVFGTVLNRFLTQAAANEPLTVYGKGGQTRGFLNIQDTIKCVTLAADNPPEDGDFRVFNQFTEQFSVKDLASKVLEAAARSGVEASIVNLDNPRVELEEHYYNAKHTALVDLGLEPVFLNEEVIDKMFALVLDKKEEIRTDLFPPSIKVVPAIVAKMRLIVCDKGGREERVSGVSEGNAARDFFLWNGSAVRVRICYH